MWYLFVYPPLQLHDFVLHADVELLEVFDRSGLDLELFELALGSHTTNTALKIYNGFEGSLVPLTRQPATDHLLNDDGLVLSQKLDKPKKDHDEKEKNTGELTVAR